MTTEPTHSMTLRLAQAQEDSDRRRQETRERALIKIAVSGRYEPFKLPDTLYLQEIRALRDVNLTTDRRTWRERWNAFWSEKAAPKVRWDHTQTQGETSHG